MTNFTEAQLKALEAAIASGATSYAYEGRTVAYRSMAEMLSVRSMMRDELGITTTKAPRRVYIATRRGV